MLLPVTRGFVSPVLPLLAIAAIAACSSGSSCPTGDLPSSCPSSGVPSYASEVAPILVQQCVGCHSPQGNESNTPLGTYADVARYRGPVLDQIDACLMPITTMLTPADRHTLLTWLVCGAPNN